jgi:hypothetical protein
MRQGVLGAETDMVCAGPHFQCQMIPSASFALPFSLLTAS